MSDGRDGEPGASGGRAVLGVMIPAGPGRPSRPQASPLDQLRGEVVATELRRRMDGWDVRIYQVGLTGGRPGIAGQPIWPLLLDGPLHDRSTNGLDAAVVAGTWAEGGLLERIAESGCPVHVAHAPSSGPGDGRPAVPDPLLLGTRMLDASLLDQRAKHLALVGALPPSEPGHLLVSLAPRQGDAVPSLVAVLAELASRSVVVVADGSGDPDRRPAAALEASVGRSPFFAPPMPALDLAAAVASAELVVSDDAGLLWLALALRRPAFGLGPAGPGSELAALAAWLGDPTAVADQVGSLDTARSDAVRRAADPRLTVGPTEELDLFLDELAAALRAAPGRRGERSVARRLAEALERARVLEAVNDGLRRNLRKQRLAFGETIMPGDLGDFDDGVPAMEHKALQERLRQTEESLAAARAELAATYATRTMRAVAPARRVYGRMRGLP